MEIDKKLRLGLSLASADLEVGELFDRYMRRCRTEGLSPNTTKRYRLSFDRFTAFCKARRVRKAGEVTVALLEDFREVRFDEGASDSAIYNETRDVKMVWKYGDEFHLIPVNHVKAFRNKKPPVGEQRCYSEEEIEKIITHAGGQDADIFTVLAFTGLRRAELQWLRWKDVDLDTGWIHVRAKDGWTTKSGKDRKLPVHPRVREVLQRLPKTHRWVFTGCGTKRSVRNGNQLHTDHLRERLQVLLKKLNLESGELHAFRRFFISYCANHGVPPTVLMRWVGHADLQMLVRYYSLRDDESQEAMAALTAGNGFPGVCTLYAHSGGPQKQPRSQPTSFKVVTTAG